MTEYEKQMEKTDDPNPKTPYSRPQLVVYGDLQEITLARQQEGGTPDSPGQNRLKTGISDPKSTPKPTSTPQG